MGNVRRTRRLAQNGVARDRLAELRNGGELYLTHALLADPHLLADVFQRLPLPPIFQRKATGQDRLLGLAQRGVVKSQDLLQSLGKQDTLIGVTGLISAVPGLSLVAAIFGLGKIAWSLWLGIVMLRRSASVVV